MTSNQDDRIGFVYVLVSPKSECIKIGGSDYPPSKRIREINTSEPYRSLGPWSLADFRQVADWRKVESLLHYVFRSKLNTDVDQQRELFYLSAQEASLKLSEIDPSLIVKKPKIDRMFQDQEFSQYIMRLFKFTGLMNWLDIQGAWTFSLFPSTAGGRYFTINIDRHEVAFSSLPPKNEPPYHMILMDKLILDFPVVSNWITEHDGAMEENAYASALPRSVALWFSGSFDDVNEFLKLDGVRRALIAYWSEALISMKERNALSFFARYHNWNAVAEINRRLSLGLT